MHEHDELHGRIGLPHHIVRAFVGQHVLLAVHRERKVEACVLLLLRLHGRGAEQGRDGCTDHPVHDA